MSEADPVGHHARDHYPVAQKGDGCYDPNGDPGATAEQFLARSERVLSWQAFYVLVGLLISRDLPSTLSDHRRYSVRCR